VRLTEQAETFHRVSRLPAVLTFHAFQQAGLGSQSYGLLSGVHG